MKKLIQQDLEAFFEDYSIEDDELYDLLLGRIGELSLEQVNQEEAILTIKLKLHGE